MFEHPADVIFMLRAANWQPRRAANNMEILIPGLALVALMVYVSTRIKRSAAKAFDEEIVETDEFTITKPEGLFIPTDATDLAFAAYSKDFGTGEAGSVRQVTTELRVHDGNTLESVRDGIVAVASKVVSEQHLAGGSMILETELSENGVLLEAERRLVEKEGKVFELAVTALSETKGAQQRGIDTLLASFEVK